MKQLLTSIIKDPLLHAKWLNTLSYLENCGARKLAACEHPTKVKEEMLKHAAEEFRHAHFLKMQIPKVYDQPLKDYSPKNLLGGFSVLHYLNRLDCEISRLCKNHPKFKEYCYLLVTYAIEIRAKEIYSIYECQLRELNSKVFVKSILLEEEEHLNEILSEMKYHNDIDNFLQQITYIEKNLFWRKIKHNLM